MRNTFTFNGVSSANFGMYISGSGRLGVPQRPYEFTSVPGRMGDLILGGNKLNNEIITYPAFIAPVNGSYGSYATLEAAISAIRNTFLAVDGYATLSDTYDSTHYRKACFSGPLELQYSSDLKTVEFEISFNAKPQRYFSNGGTTTTISSGSNQTFSCTGKRAAPIYEVTGTGYFIISGSTGGAYTTIDRPVITENDTKIFIDTDRMECYDAQGNSENLNVNTYFKQINKPFKDVFTSVKITTSGVTVKVTFNWYEL